jgi:putative hemolysin
LDYPSDYFFIGHIFTPLLLVANVQATTLLAAVVLILLLLSFFVSGAKVAFFSLSYRDINMLKTKQDTAWKRIVNLLEDARMLYATLMIANTLVNIAIIILGNYLIDQVLVLKESAWTGLISYAIKIVIIASLIILFGQILPKVRATQNNLRAAYETSFLVEVIYYLFRRLGIWMIRVSDSVEKAFGGKKSRIYAQQQMEQAIKSTVPEEEEQRILAGIYKFAHITVKQIMITRLDVHGVEYDTSFGDLKKRVEELHYSRLPVYKGSLDNIMGIVYTKDLLPYLNEPDSYDWHHLLRAPYFVHEHKFIEDLLKEFQKRRVHFAVVVDEFGGTSGIVTLEDILEEVIGDIRDEFDEEDSGIKKVDETTYVFDGRTMIHDATKAMNLPADTFDMVRGDSDSLAGLILEFEGDIPKENSVVTIGDFEFTILEVDHSRIRKVKVTIKPQLV